MIMIYNDPVHLIETTNNKPIKWPDMQEGFVPVRGLQVALKTKDKDDKVLLICNLPTSTQETLAHCTTVNGQPDCLSRTSTTGFAGP